MQKKSPELLDEKKKMVFTIGRKGVFSIYGLHWGWAECFSTNFTVTKNGSSGSSASEPSISGPLEPGYDRTRYQIWLFRNLFWIFYNTTEFLPII